MKRTFLLAMAVMAAGVVGGLGGVVRGAGDEGNGKGVKVDEGRKAEALKLVKKAGMTGADDMPEQWIREDIGAVAGAIGDSALLKAAVDAERDRWAKIEIYTDVAHEQAARGDMAGAKKSVAAAAALLALPDQKAAAPTTEPELDDRVMASENVVDAQVDVGDFAGAAATAKGMKLTGTQAELYAKIASAEMKGGNKAAAAEHFAEAEAIVGKLREEDHPMFNVDMLAMDEARGGAPDRAKKLLAGLKDPADAANDAASIAMLLGEDGRSADAKAFIDMAQASVAQAGKGAGGQADLVDTYGLMARAYGAIGDKQRAMDMLGKLRSQMGGLKEPLSARDLLEVAMVEDRLGLADDSDKTLEKVVDALPSDENGNRTHTLWEMSRTLAMYGDVWDAADFIEKAQKAQAIDPMEVGMISRGIAEELAMSDGPDAKLAWVDKLAEEPGVIERRMVYAAAAKGMVEAGENPKVRRFEAIAAVGDSYAMTRLGAIYEYGFGVPVDLKKAVSWYEKADAAGSFHASYSLGVMYKNGDGVPEDMGKAFAMVKKAAEGGYVPAYASVGMCYENGEGTPEDEAAGIGWIRKGADEGDGFALYLMGSRYRTGQGVTKDLKEAMNYYQKAAEKDEEHAMFHIGEMYEKGEGVAKDMTAARTWYQKAADSGSGDAADWLKAHPE
ncbi:MAG TPA: tetratricopeptide repeat protein [Phycisphaerae bacterium]|nr:tetratricopeptide repeat protein [Phycisphaerae bacterium]